jgi:hypothetical protein
MTMIDENFRCDEDRKRVASLCAFLRKAAVAFSLIHRLLKRSADIVVCALAKFKRSVKKRFAKTIFYFIDCFFPSIFQLYSFSRKWICFFVLRNPKTGNNSKPIGFQNRFDAFDKRKNTRGFEREKMFQEVNQQNSSTRRAFTALKRNPRAFAKLQRRARLTQGTTAPKRKQW